MRTIRADEVAAEAVIKIESTEVRVFDAVGLGDTIVLWYGDGERYECDAATTFELIRNAPKNMTTPELVRELIELRVAIATWSMRETTSRLRIVVDELRNRGVLD